MKIILKLISSVKSAVFQPQKDKTWSQTIKLIFMLNSLEDERVSSDKVSHYRASDFFQDWWAEMTHGAKYGGSPSEMVGPSIVDIWVVYFTYTLSQTLV